MKYRMNAAIVLNLAAVAGNPALAQAQVPQPTQAPQQELSASDEIVVTGVRVSTLDLPRLRKAQDAFRAGRAAFAPTSTLYFQLRPAAGVALAGMTLALVRGDQRIVVPIDAESRFTLPDIPAGRWELEHNRGAGRIAVRALVMSAGATETERPLGDLRLQCRAGWELAKAGYSFIARSGFSVLGGCSSTKFAFAFRTPRIIRSATLSTGAKVTELPLLPDRMAVRAPLGDKALPNNAMVRVRYN